MALEIERKFLVIEPLNVILARYLLVRRTKIEQSYLSGSGSWTIRARRTQTFLGRGQIKIDHHLTMKKKQSDISCVELEYPISKSHYQDVIGHCDHTLEKIRYVIRVGDHYWEIDQFSQDPFSGLIVAEIELKDEGEEFVRPPWLGEEVTQDKSYKNVRMAKQIRRV